MLTKTTFSGASFPVLVFINSKGRGMISCITLQILVVYQNSRKPSFFHFLVKNGFSSIGCIECKNIDESLMNKDV